MRLNEKNVDGLALDTLNSDVTDMNVADESEMMTALAEHRSYHEMKDSPILEVNSLTQLRTNLEVLSDLTSRLTFLNREIRYMMKVD